MPATDFDLQQYYKAERELEWCLSLAKLKSVLRISSLSDQEEIRKAWRNFFPHYRTVKARGHLEECNDTAPDVYKLARKVRDVLRLVHPTQVPPAQCDLSQWPDSTWPTGLFLVLRDLEDLYKNYKQAQASGHKFPFSRRLT